MLLTMAPVFIFLVGPASAQLGVPTTEEITLGIWKPKHQNVAYAFPAFCSGDNAIGDFCYPPNATGMPIIKTTGCRKIVSCVNVRKGLVCDLKLCYDAESCTNRRNLPIAENVYVAGLYQKPLGRQPTKARLLKHCCVISNSIRIIESTCKIVAREDLLCGSRNYELRENQLIRDLSLIGAEICDFEPLKMYGQRSKLHVCTGDEKTTGTPAIAGMGTGNTISTTRPTASSSSASSEAAASPKPKPFVLLAPLTSFSETSKAIAGSKKSLQHVKEKPKWLVKMRPTTRAVSSNSASASSSQEAAIPPQANPAVSGASSSASSSSTEATASKTSVTASIVRSASTSASSSTEAPQD